MPVLPVCLLEPLWEQFAALLPERPLVSPTHPLGCHRRRVPDRVVFEHVAALVDGSGYERIASPGCSDGTIRRRLKEWAAAGLSEQVHALALRAYERMIGLDLRPSRSTAASPRRREARWPAARRWIGAKRGEASRAGPLFPGGG